jgi:peptidoglycan hydrolase CwlO-like protein
MTSKKKSDDLMENELKHLTSTVSRIEGAVMAISRYVNEIAKEQAVQSAEIKRFHQDLKKVEKDTEDNKSFKNRVIGYMIAIPTGISVGIVGLGKLFN